MSDAVYLNTGDSITSVDGTVYKNIQTLGTGGNAVAFLVIATNNQLNGNLFSLKIFRKISNPERRDKFLSEIEFLKLCNHPAIMQYYDNGIYSLEASEYPFVINEYMPFTLADMLKTKLTIVQKLLFSVQLLSAVSYLEDKGYVHRDIKPQNIFVKGNTCILGDFGLIKKIEDEVETTDREFFKESQGPGMAFFYRTPDLIEYANGRSNLSIKTDVFQLGLVFAQMFTGFNPSQKPESYYSPLVLNELKRVKGDLGYPIGIQIQKMLTMNCTERPLASEVMAEWQSILLSAANMSKRVNGYSI